MGMTIAIVIRIISKLPGVDKNTGDTGITKPGVP